MPSINQQHRHPDRLPDFHNIGVWLRAVLIVTALSAAATVAMVDRWAQWPEEFSIVSLHVQPAVVVALVLLAVTAPLLRLLPYRAGLVAVIAGAVASSILVDRIAGFLLPVDPVPASRVAFFAAGAAAVALLYFHLRGRALSPALSEARLQALQARIRPHFLFNSLNAVLSLVRSEPRRAEAALEDMADLFRVLMADNRELAPLEDEVRLCRRYLDLEQLRLGERLRVEWHVDKMPRDALVPPLVLQPLLENAVYHGIEPSSAPGVILINIYHVRGELHMVLRNPYRTEGSHHGGNKMAVGNIRERLALHFDEEGRLETLVTDDTYQVHIRMPYRHASAAAS